MFYLDNIDYEDFKVVFILSDPYATWQSCI